MGTDSQLCYVDSTSWVTLNPTPQMPVFLKDPISGQIISRMLRSPQTAQLRILEALLTPHASPYPLTQGCGAPPHLSGMAVELLPAFPHQLPSLGLL